MKNIALALIATLSFAAAANAGPSKAGDVCQLKVDGQPTSALTFEDADGQGFFAAANQMTRQLGCVYAKVDSVPNSGRVYIMNNGQPSLAPSASGQKRNLSNSEAREAMSNSSISCTTISCIPLVDNTRPQNEQPMQIPSQPQVPVQGTDWN